MSAYNGRRGVNVSQYVANLNTIPSPDDLVDNTTPPNLEADLALFTNNDFIDWDAGRDNFDRTLSLDNINFEPPTNSRTSRASGGEAKMDFSALNGNFEFADFAGFQNPIVDPSMQSTNFAVPPSFTSPVSTTVSPVAPGFEQSTGKKRKLDHVESLNEQSVDESVRVAAEEDKRRRNTAASARFRVKKKQREQALEKTAKEMTDRVQVLETRIQQLETENAWLKGLITEKNGGKATSSEVSALLKKHIEDTASERRAGNRTDGVGTKLEGAKA